LPGVACRLFSPNPPTAKEQKSDRTNTIFSDAQKIADQAIAAFPTLGIITPSFVFDRNIMKITLSNLSVQFETYFSLNSINWEITSDQHWAIVGTNGSGKSALAAILTGAGDIIAGEINGLPQQVAIASFEAQAELIEAELKKDDADLLDVVSIGTPVRELLDQTCSDQVLQQRLIEAFNLEGLLDRGFRKLSSGESRKLMLIRALTSRAQLLILDEPFEGLDANSCLYLHQLLEDIAQHTSIVMVLNRLDEIPDFISHIAYVNNAVLALQIDTNDCDAMSNLTQLMHLKTTGLSVPAAAENQQSIALDIYLDKTQPLVRMRQVRVAYGDSVIFSDLDWTIQAGQHWQVTGPNGSGKTCLLNLITGDHPQCYINDIFVFGMQRGNGESIWQIKQHLGYVSSALQWEYRVTVSVRNAIISGFYDSIGIYQQYTDEQKSIADHWLALLGMSNRADEPFNQLSFGDQRLILIARAMVKHPSLLILDEPCLGLDDLNRQLVLALIEKICEGLETTVLYVNHRSEDSIQGIQNHLAMT
jgi:molybdate transport system ATP-binding protein